MLSTEWENKLRAAMAAADTAAQRAEDAVPGPFSRAWAWGIGADSASHAASNAAIQARRAADVLREKGTALIADPRATDADAARLLGIGIEATIADLATTVADTSAELSPGAAVRETVGGSLADLGLPTSLAGWSVLVRVALAVGVLAVGVLFVRDARRALRS